MSLLTERIKRAGKNRPTIRAGPDPVSKPTKVVRPNMVSQEAANGIKESYQDMEQPQLQYR